MRTESKKLLSPRKGSPLEPRYVGICTIGTKKFQTHTKKVDGTIFFIKRTPRKQS